MKPQKHFLHVTIVSAVLFCMTMVWAAPMGSAFNYQGRLLDDNMAADGLYDIQFELYDDSNILVANQIGSTIDANDVQVVDGYFIAELDFGSSAFNGDGRWLQIAVRPGEETGGYNDLSPLQPITPTPYAIHAKKADEVAGGIGISGSGTANYVPKFLDAATLGDSTIIETASGNVGIGTAYPTDTLTVSGDIKVRDSDSDTFLIIDSSSGNNSYLYFKDYGDTKWFFKHQTDYDLTLYQYFWDVATDCMSWEYGTARVGIGTESPASKLSINGDIDISGSRLYVGTDGRVGIGTASPTDTLTIAGDVTIRDPDENTVLTLDSSAGNNAYLYFKDYGDTKWFFKHQADYDLTLYQYFLDTATNCMSWEYGTARVGIGTESPDSKLSIIGDVDISGSRLHVGTDGKVGIGRDDPTTVLHVSRDTPATSTTHPSTVMVIEDGNSNAYLQIVAPASNHRAVLFGEAGGQVNDGQVGYDDSEGMRFWVDRGGADLVPLQIQMDGDVITGTGNVGIGSSTPARKLFVNGDAGGATSWYNDSDARLKKDIVTIDNALEKVSLLRGVQFEWNKPEDHAEGKQIGFIGQETVEVVPEVVDVKDGQYSMQYAPLTALLVEAVKELKADNECLKQQLEKQEKILQKLETAMTKGEIQ